MLWLWPGRRVGQAWYCCVPCGARGLGQCHACKVVCIPASVMRPVLAYGGLLFSGVTPDHAHRTFAVFQRSCSNHHHHKARSSQCSINVVLILQRCAAVRRGNRMQRLLLQSARASRRQANVRASNGRRLGHAECDSWISGSGPCNPHGLHSQLQETPFCYCMASSNPITHAQHS